MRPFFFLFLFLLSPLISEEGKKIAIYTYNAGGKTWDPQSIHQGLTGSEEAVVYLSDKLAKMGYEVTIFGNPPEGSPHSEPGSNPLYLPFQAEAGQKFDIAIAWRQPKIGLELKKRAHKVYLWPHDIFYDPLEAEQIDAFDNVMWLSEWQKSQWCKGNPGFSRFTTIVGNGVNLEQFEEVRPRENPHACIYGSNYGQGLEYLLDIWPSIKSEFPSATLDIYYGWQHWGFLTQAQEEKMRKQIEEYASLDVHEHGMVGHEELNCAYSRASIWAYPCTLHETFCITALRAQKAGCIPVVIDTSALRESVRHGYKALTQEEYKERLRSALNDAPRYTAEERKKFGQFINEEYTWAHIAEKWDKIFHSCPPKKFDPLIFAKDIIDHEPHSLVALEFYAENLKIAEKFALGADYFTKRFEQATELEEKYKSALYKGEFLKLSGSPEEEVIASYRKCVELKPYSAEPRYHLSNLYNQLGKFQQAYDLIKSYRETKEDTSPEWLKKYGLLMPLSLAAYHLGHVKESFQSCNTLLKSENLSENWKSQLIINRSFALEKLCGSDNKKVLIAILARNKAHVLPFYLSCLEHLDYDKNLITLYINTNTNCDETEEILHKWIDKHGHLYGGVDFVSHNVELDNSDPHNWTPLRTKQLGAIRNESLKKTLEHGCGYYFVADCDNFIHPETLKYLISKNKPIIAPLLLPFPEPNDHYSTFFADVRENGFYKHHEDFYKIVKKTMVGTFKVPFVHSAYLIQADFIDFLDYEDTSGQLECIIFGRSARENGVDQYICNEIDFGLFLNFNDAKNCSLEREKWLFSEFLKMQKNFHLFFKSETTS